MKTHYILLILYFIVINFFTQAQENSYLTGKVTYDCEAIAFASVHVIQNGEIITGTATNSDGIYNLSIVAGTYVVEVRTLDFARDKVEFAIKAGETKTIDFQLAEARFDIISAFDTIKITAIEVNEIDVRFNIILDNHIKEMHRSLIFNKKKYLCVVRIDNNLDVYHTNIFKQYIPNINNVIDSIYENYKDYNFDHTYDIGIRTLHRQSRSINWLKSHQKIFYYNYKGWDILFVSNLNIDFPNNEKYKELKFIVKNYFSNEEIMNGKIGYNFKECISSYSISNYSVIQRNFKNLFNTSCGVPNQ